VVWISICQGPAPKSSRIKLLEATKVPLLTGGISPVTILALPPVISTISEPMVTELPSGISKASSKSAKKRGEIWISALYCPTKQVIFWGVWGMGCPL